MCQVTLMSRTFSTSRIQREVIQANGQRGSNQKSAFVMWVTTPSKPPKIPPEGPSGPGPTWPVRASPRPGAAPSAHPRQGVAEITISLRARALVRGCDTCLEPTSPGTRPPPAPPSWTSRRTPSTWTSRPATRPSARPRPSGSPAAEPGAETFADLVDATVHEITLNGEPVDPATAYADNRIALAGLAADNELVVRADCTYSRTGEGLHRFVDPVDERVYLYSQFEVPDARRVYTTFEQPDLKAPVHVQRDRADRLEGRLERADARAAGAAARGRAAGRCGASPRPSRCRPTSPPSWPASTTRC